MNKRAILLGRVSTRKESQTTSLERQESELRAEAARRGWTVVGWFSDRSTGKSLQRPGLGQALDLVFAGKADVLVVHSLDRLGRNVREMIETIDALAAVGCGFLVTDSGLDATGPMGRLVFTVFAAIAQFHREKNSEAIRGGLAHAAKRGRYPGRPRTVDYSRLDEAAALRAGGATWGEVVAACGGSTGGWSRALERRDSVQEEQPQE
jgi:DNA invertase Pin-like site-specific DNA recombinase